MYAVDHMWRNCPSTFWTMCAILNEFQNISRPNQASNISYNIHRQHLCEICCKKVQINRLNKIHTCVACPSDCASVPHCFWAKKKFCWFVMLCKNNSLSALLLCTMLVLTVLKLTTSRQNFQSTWIKDCYAGHKC